MVNVQDLAAFMGFDDEQEFIDKYPDCRKDLAMIKARLTAYIIPNVVCASNEVAFDQACYAQFAHEHSDAAKELAQMPSGLKSFTVNGFSASIDSESKSAESNFFKAGVSPETRALLLTAGLLYRGIGR